MSRLISYFLLAFTGSIILSCYSIKNNTYPVPASTLKGKAFETITLETSLKPFKKNDKAYIRSVAVEMFTQWASLLKHADTVAIMLWTSDGSEILNYSGRLGQPLEWGRYIGNPNTKHPVGSGPKELSLHERAYLYMDNPPSFTYNDLKQVIKILKETGRELTSKPIIVGATFDPGPEFARSDFKYKKHPEILQGNAMGTKSFVNCYSVLKADKESYAGFPNGIEANTPFGKFFGRQSRHFLKDMGFDYLWLSNGFGFGMEAWSSKGAIFDGKAFDAGKLAEIQSKNLGFWKLFRVECPEFQVQTRGTNLSTGTDLARDGVDLRGIYKGGFNLLPPPNSPWAALDGDFGMELVGYMSRIAELPDNRFLFRYYIHDPWWVNSPWLDRYDSEPHDIYMPMAVSRINAQGEVTLPSQLNFLSIDNSFGNLPKQIPDEVTPHILKARYNAPTAPGPIVWVYPFDEYHDWTYQEKGRQQEVYFGDWFIRQAINNGFPLNTVISTASFNRLIKDKPAYFKESILLTVVPSAGSPLENELIRFVENGGKLMVYGPADHASEKFLALLNLKNISALEGEFQVRSAMQADKLEQSYPQKIRHQSLFSGGGVSTLIKDKNEIATRLLAGMQQATANRDVLWSRAKPEWNGGQLIYIRGTNSSSAKGHNLLTPDDPAQWATGPLYLRYALQEFGYYFLHQKQSPAIKSPVLTISRSKNAYYFSGYLPATTVKQTFKFPWGAPVFSGYQTKIENGYSTYHFPTAWHKECRVFVKQNDGMVSCRELYSGDKDISRRIEISGLKDADLTFYPELVGKAGQVKAYLNSGYPWKTGTVDLKEDKDLPGSRYILENVTGTVVLSW